MDGESSLWAWAAGIAASIVLILLGYIIRRINSRMSKLEEDVEGNTTALSSLGAECTQKHIAIDRSLSSGRERFRAMETLVRDELRSVNTTIQTLCTNVGELKGSIDTVLKRFMQDTK